MTINNENVKEEHELVEKCQRGDNSAFKKLYEKYNDKVYNITFYMLRDRETAKEVTQQIFIKIYNSLSTFKFQAGINSWIYKLATNYCIDHMRKRKRNRLLPLDSLSDYSQFIDTTSQEEMHFKIHISEAVQKVIMNLKPKFRSVIVLKYINDLSYAEIADVLDCSIGTVSSRLNRSHKILSDQLKFLKG